MPGYEVDLPTIMARVHDLALAQSPDLATQTGQTKCGVKASAAKPLVVEWPAADRASWTAVRRSRLQPRRLTNVCAAVDCKPY